MTDTSGGIVLLVVLVFLVWVYIILPAQMEINRKRSALGWAFISLVFSPVVAIIALIVLGVPYRENG